MLTNVSSLVSCYDHLYAVNDPSKATLVCGAANCIRSCCLWGLILHSGCALVWYVASQTNSICYNYLFHTQLWFSSCINSGPFSTWKRPNGGELGLNGMLWVCVLQVPNQKWQDKLHRWLRIFVKSRFTSFSSKSQNVFCRFCRGLHRFYLPVDPSLPKYLTRIKV